MTVAPLRTSGGHRAAEFDWPRGFDRVPDADWVHEPVDRFGLGYDRVDAHTWCQNLEPVVAQVLSVLEPGKLLIDYSCGTGILARRLLARIDHPVGVLNVDASSKFLRVAVENLRGDPRVAFRLLRYLRAENRLQSLDEVVDAPLCDQAADLLTATNAIHLYQNLPETLGSWHRVVRPGGLVLACSGNVASPGRRPDNWILDETVARVNEIAARLVATEPAFERYRATLTDSAAMAAHTRFRERVFVPVRPLEEYLDAFTDAGFRVLHTFDTTVHARVDQWCELLHNYHEGVLSWVGGSPKVDNREPTEDALRDRMFLIRYGLERLFPDQDSFPCGWTYITCRR